MNSEELKFRECEYGYIATDGLRMCKITREEKLSIDVYTDVNTKHAKFIEIWRAVKC